MVGSVGDRLRVIQQARCEVAQADARLLGGLRFGELDDFLVGALGEDLRPGLVGQLVGGGAGNRSLVTETSADVTFSGQGFARRGKRDVPFLSLPFPSLPFRP